jgi:hypothetical protein
MEPHGTILSKFEVAVQSARRLRGHPLHPDTLEYWTKLLHHARRELAGNLTEPILPLVLELEEEMANRSA